MLILKACKCLHLTFPTLMQNLCKDNLMRKNKRISKRSRFSVKHLHHLSANQLLALYDVTESRYPDMAISGT